MLLPGRGLKNSEGQLYHTFCFLFLQTAITISSNSACCPCCVIAEHSTYATAPISLCMRNPYARESKRSNINTIDSQPHQLLVKPPRLMQPCNQCKGAWEILPVQTRAQRQRAELTEQQAAIWHYSHQATILGHGHNDVMDQARRG